MIIVYSKFIKIPLGTASGGIIRLTIINKSPEYMNIVTTGETTEVAIIPIGAKLPNIFKETGAVKICAPVEEPSEAEKYPGRKRLYMLLKNLFVSKIPASAVYESINPTL